MKTHTINTYSYEELSKEAKEKALEWWRNNNDYPFLSDAMEEHLKDLLIENNIESEGFKILYSLSNSKGDGAMFTGDFTFKGETFRVTHSGHYYHEYSKVIETLSESENDDVLKEFETLYVKICLLLKKYGYDYIEEEDSEERIKEVFECSEYEFTANGKVWSQQ